MDELQLTISNGKTYLWGISSHPEEQFVPKNRLYAIWNKLFSLSDPAPAKIELELPASNGSIMVSNELKLSYGQYEDHTLLTKKKFLVDSFILDFKILKDEFLLSEKKAGFYFGDSYEGFKRAVQFTYSLIARQRFIPFHREGKSFFQVNLDNHDDFLIFKSLCNELPKSITAKDARPMEEALHAFLSEFTDYLIREFVKDLKIGEIPATPSDKWIYGLCKERSKVDEALTKSLSEWVTTRNVGKMQGYYLLFKLKEPDEHEKGWQLSYYLQSKNDPSLLISLKDIWENKKKIALQNYKLYFIQELGMAAKCSKFIEKSMLKPNPSSILLSENEALSFIKSDSFMLKDFGFVVHIPKITSAKLNSLRVMVNFKKPKILKTASINCFSSALFDFDYEIAVGDSLTLTNEEFYQLSRQKSELVCVNGKWVEVNPDDVKKVISFFEKKKQLSLSEVIYAGASGEVEFALETKNFPEEWGRAFLSSRSTSLEKQPEAFCGQLRKYQREGYSWLILLRKLGFGGILADDMGLGKTIQAISYLLYLKQAAVKKPSLIIAPTSVIGNWEHELQKFSPSLAVYLHHGLMRKKCNFNAKVSSADVVITSYGTLRRDKTEFAGILWEVVILDEAQNIKNPYTIQAISIGQLSAQHRLCLTGTPIENRLSELWSLMNFSNSWLLSSWENFKRSFAEPIELNADAEKTIRLRKILAPFILRRLKTDKKIIQDLPEKTEIKEYCPLTEEQATLYQAVLDESLSKIKESAENRRMHILATIIKLKQICNHPTNLLKDTQSKFLGRSGKLERLCEMVEIFLQNNEKCLIFTQFREMGAILKQTLEEYFSEPVLFLHGQTSRKEREKMIAMFQNENKPKIFVLSLKAGGLGINLTAANQVIHFDRWWNPAVENQAADRAYRIGQQRNVFIYKYITSGTIEEKIDELLEAKSALSNVVLAKGGAALTELDDEKLKEIFSLRRDSFAATRLNQKDR
ncbi:MAG: DEAD/DEAH box helicase [Nanoarchaeota archaeon]